MVYCYALPTFIDQQLFKERNAKPIVILLLT